MPTKAVLEAELESLKSLQALVNMQAVYIGEEMCGLADCQMDAVYRITAPNGTITSLCEEHATNLQCFLEDFGVIIRL